MSQFWSLFDSSGFTQNAFYLDWSPGLLWLRICANAVIMGSYISIPTSLIWLMRRRRDPAYRWVVCVFAIFILADAVTHGLSVLTIWVPAYGVEGVAEAATAATSVTLAYILWIMAPRLAGMLSSNQLTDLNAVLSATVTNQTMTLRELRDVDRGLRASISDLETNLSRQVEALRRADTRMRGLAAERVNAEALLAKSEAEYKASFTSATIGKVQIDPRSGDLLLVNTAFASILGYEAEDLVSRKIWDLVYPEDRSAARIRFDKLLVHETDPRAMETRLIRRDGVAVWVRICTTVVFDPAAGFPRLALADIEYWTCGTTFKLHCGRPRRGFVWRLKLRISELWNSTSAMACSGRARRLPRCRTTRCPQKPG
jgi:PAS domain S-box-containing protein